MSIRKFDTCFFEQYALISLSALLGSEFDGLVNLDRPDLQSPDEKSVGIEVTRAMEVSKSAEQALLKDLAGLTVGEYDDEQQEQRNASYMEALKRQNDRLI